MKTPVQARSIHTVEVIFQATVQVLVELGLHQLTTTKVATRAGVSIGTLYQYFPNKSSLLAAALERHLAGIVEKVSQACALAKHQPLKVMAASVVEAFVNAKLFDARASKAFYAVASEAGSAQLVGTMTQRSQLALCDMLATAQDAKFEDLRTISYVLSTALVGPVQGLLQYDMPASFVAGIKEQLVLMTSAYLREAANASGVNTQKKDAF